MMDIGILVLAGSSKEDWVEKYGVQTKLELPVENETPLIVHTWNGVKETNLPCVIATDSWLAEKYHLEPHVDATSNIAETLTNAAQQLDTEFLLVLSADMPFITAESIKQLIKEAQEGGERDIYVLIVPKESIEQAFPGAPRTYVKLKEGYFKLANGVLIRKDFFMSEVKRADDLLGNRKSPLKVATILGLGTIFKAVTGTLDVPYIWKMIESRFHVKAYPVFTSRPEFGFDIDKEEHYLKTLELIEKEAN